MKYFSLLIVGLAFTISSCSPLFFSEAQPKNTKELLEYPKELQGVYVDGDKDTLRITDNAFYWGTPGQMEYMSDTLDETSHIRKSGKFYYLNILEEGRWLVIPATFEHRNTLVVFFSDLSNPADESVLKQYGRVETFYTEEGKIDYFILSPMNKDAIEKMIRKGGVFQETRLRKLN